MTLRATSLAFIAATLLAATSVAQAFTVEDQGGSRSGQSFTDDKPAPDRHAVTSQFGTNGQTTVKQGNTTFQFGQQRSFGDRYNTDSIFNPYAREGR